MNDYAPPVYIRCPGQGSHPGNEPFPTALMSQLYDRDAGEVLGLYMPLRNAPVRSSASRTPAAGQTGTLNTSREI